MGRTVRKLLPSAAGPAQASPAYPTVAVARRAVAGWTDLKEKRRANLDLALNALTKLAGKPEGAVVLDPSQLSGWFLEATAAAAGVKPSSLVTYKSNVRAVMRRLGLLGGPSPRIAPLSPWAALRESLPNKGLPIQEKHLTLRLQRFVAFCAERGVHPHEVGDDTLASYVEHLRTECLVRSAIKQGRQTAAAWNRASAEVAGWPQAQLRAPEAKRRRYSLPFEDLPQGLQEDIEAFRRNISSAREGLFHENPRDPPRSTSIASYMGRLQRAIGALVHAGVEPAAITSLAVLVRPANLKLIINWHWRRTRSDPAQRKPKSSTGAIAETLRIVAKYHLGLKGAALEEVVAIVRRAKPPARSRMTAKNERRLAQLDDLHNLSRLLHLPNECLMKAARQLAADGHPLQAARLASVAVAIEIELRCPMRAQNLAHLRIGKEIVRLDSRRRRFTHFIVDGEDAETGGVKNGEPFTWPINPAAARLIEEYVRDHRPHLAAPGTDWLFPHRDHADRPRRPHNLSKSIAGAIWRHVGIRMHTHLFRAFAASQLLEENPGAIEDLRLILGHKTLATSLIYYASCRPERAAMNLDGLLTRRKAETRSAAVAAFARQTSTAKPRRNP